MKYKVNKVNDSNLNHSNKEESGNQNQNALL